jgi:hypothetical protein
MHPYADATHSDRPLTRSCRSASRSGRRHDGRPALCRDASSSRGTPVPRSDDATGFARGPSTRRHTRSASTATGHPDPTIRPAATASRTGDTTNPVPGLILRLALRQVGPRSRRIGPGSRRIGPWSRRIGPAARRIGAAARQVHRAMRLPHPLPRQPAPAGRLPCALSRRRHQSRRRPEGVLGGLCRIVAWIEAPGTVERCSCVRSRQQRRVALEPRSSAPPYQKHPSASSPNFSISRDRKYETPRSIGSGYVQSRLMVAS